VFWVNDNGSGIPHDKIDKLFSKFYQIDTTLTRKHGGTGLGLAVSKGIVEAHGGKIWVDKNYKDGASIRFTLPAIEDDDPDSIPKLESALMLHKGSNAQKQMPAQKFEK
jgi:signal transduction histidine kinase